MARPLGGLLAAVVLAAFVAPAHAAPAGDVRLHRAADAGFGPFLDAASRARGAASRARQAWIRRTYVRMRAYAPYFDSQLSWYRNAWAYQDLYAVYADDREDGSHLPYVLKDARGRRLYIPWGCDGSGCPQYAGDPGSPAFRRLWLREARRKVAAGYRGLYVDDVALERFVSDASGHLVAPIDPRTGRPMTRTAWRRYVSDFVAQIRRALPRVEIAHNYLWWAGPLSDPLVRRQVGAADWLLVEHAFLDWGLTGGHGPSSYRAFMRHIDALHRIRRRVVLESSTDTPARRMVLLAGYLMVNNGRDLLSTGYGTDPPRVWRGFRLGLGRALGRRYRWRGVWRRDFQRGTALLSEPGAPRRRLRIAGRSLAGRRVHSVVLQDRAGAVVLRRPGRRLGARR
jgi:hypothetical protein